MADQIVQFEGTEHHFPPDFTQADIAKALTMTHGGGAPTPGMEKLGGAPPSAAKAPLPVALRPGIPGHPDYPSGDPMGSPIVPQPMAAFQLGAEALSKLDQVTGMGQPGIQGAPVLPSPGTEPAMADKLAPVGNAVVQGMKSAAPDVAMGSAKVAAGAVLPKVPGLTYGLEYKGGRQAMQGLKKGVDAFKSALSQKVEAAATAAQTEAADPTLNAVAQMQGHKDFASAPLEAQAGIKAAAGKIAQAPQMSPEQVSAFTGESASAEPTQSAPAPAAAPQPPFQPKALLPAASKPALITPPPPDPSFVRGIPAQYPPAPQEIPANTANPPSKVVPINAQQLQGFPSKAAADWLAKRNGIVGPYDTANGNELVPDVVKPAKLSPEALKQQLRDEMLRNGTATADNLLPADEPGSEDLSGPLRDMMRDVPDGMHKSVAKANYAGDQEPTVAAQVYEAAGRADKANKLAAALHKGGISAEDAARMDPEHWQMLSQALGVHVPSKASIGEALFRLKRLEASK